MKNIKAQRATQILQNILPLSAIDMQRDVMSIIESSALFELWKKAEANDNIFSVPVDCDRRILASLKYKGYLDYNGLNIKFTKRGAEAIKLMILNREENTFKKGN